MNKKYTLGITIHNFEHVQTYILLRKLINNDINIDFIIYHQKFYKRIIIRLIKTILNKDSKEKKYLLKKISKVKTYNIPDINSAKATKVLKKFAPSMVICNTGIIKKKTILENKDTYLINVHGSKLPKYRGASNLHWALWDEEDIYVTVHRINNGIDEGDILYQELIIKNTGNMMLPEKLNNLTELMAGTVCKTIIEFFKCGISFTKQEHLGEPLMQYYSMHPILVEILKDKYSKR